MVRQLEWPTNITLEYFSKREFFSCLYSLLILLRFLWDDPSDSILSLQQGRIQIVDIEKLTITHGYVFLYEAGFVSKLTFSSSQKKVRFQIDL